MDAYTLFFMSAQYFDQGLYLVYSSLATHMEYDHPDVEKTTVDRIASRSFCSVCESLCQMIEVTTNLMDKGSEVQIVLYNQLQRSPSHEPAQPIEEPKTPLPEWLNDVNIDL